MSPEHFGRASDRYRVRATDRHGRPVVWSYPYGRSLRRVLDAGGVSKVPPLERERLKWRTKRPGAIVRGDELPQRALDTAVADGYIERIEEGRPSSARAGVTLVGRGVKKR